MRCSLCGSATRPWHEPRDFIVAVQQLLWKVHCALKLGSTARAEDWNKAVSGSKLQLRESSNRRDENRQNAWFIALPLYRSSFCSCRESFNHIYIYIYIYMYICISVLCGDCWKREVSCRVCIYFLTQKSPASCRQYEVSWLV